MNVGGTVVKVGIVTIVSNKPNFGNKLQNYATILLLRELGANVCTLKSVTTHNLFELYTRILLNGLSGCHLSSKQLQWKRQVVFCKFDNEYLNITDELVKGKLKTEEFDYFIVGSDQVWNPTWYEEATKEAFLLNFARDEQKVCMAPSFGISEMPEEWKRHFAKYLNTFKYLSVREESGVRIVEELTGKKAEVVIDPTLMISAMKWRELEKKMKRRENSKPYILKYFLGAQDKKTKDYINDIAAKEGLEVYELLDEKEEDLYLAGPREFLDLIDHAQLICTDSFHACVFSILFDKPFLVFERDGTGAGMSTRISTLLGILGLEKRMPGAVKEENIFDHNYVEAYKKLETERKKAYLFLKKSLNL